ISRKGSLPAVAEGAKALDRYIGVSPANRLRVEVKRNVQLLNHIPFKSQLIQQVIVITQIAETQLIDQVRCNDAWVGKQCLLDAVGKRSAGIAGDGCDHGFVLPAVAAVPT